MSGKSLAAALLMTIPRPAWPFSVTMPTDAPVTLEFDDLDLDAGRPADPSQERERPQREPAEYHEPAVSGQAADPEEALKTLGLILAAPVVIVGGTLQVAGKSFSDWLEERRRQREAARFREGQLQRRLLEERLRLEALIAELEARAEEGREPLYQALGLLLDSITDEAAAETGPPFEGIALGTNVPGKAYTRQNDFDAEILAAYRELWSDPSYRPLLQLITPRHLKAMIAWESRFNPEFRKECAFGPKTCRIGRRIQKADKQGVGLTALTRPTATHPRLAALRVDSEADERLDPPKAIRGALAVLRKYHQDILRGYRRERAIPEEAFLRDLLILAYNTSPYGLMRALRETARKKTQLLEDLRLGDLEPVTLRRHLGNEKYRREASKYLKGIERWLDSGARKKEP